MYTLPAINYEVPINVDGIYHTLGYKFKYTPYILAKDIAHVMSHWKLVGRVSGFVGGDRGFNKKYKEFLYSIPFDLYKENTPYYMAVEIIKALSSKYNFRDMEKAIVSQDEDYDFIGQEDCHNPEVDMENLTTDVVETLGVDIHARIPFEIIKILKETEKFTKLFSSTLNPEISKMTSYSQIKSVSKYKLKLPTFNYKYALKNYNINQGSPKEIVIFRDISQSAIVMEAAMKGLLLYFMNTYTGRIITVHEFTDMIENSITLKSIEDIKEYYKKPTTYYLARLKFLPKYIKNYSECYIVSKGSHDLYPKTLNCIINGISRGDNKALRLLCKNTKGKYVMI